MNELTKMDEMEIKQCKINFCQDPEKVWTLRIDSVGDACCDALTDVTSKLGPNAKRFLGRRIETDNHDVETFLASIGLRPQIEKSR